MYLPLSQLLAIGRSPDHPVAVRGGETIGYARFRADIAHNAQRLKAAHCQTGAPVCQDSYWFMVGFLALLHAGAGIVLPANTQSGTLATLSGDCDLLLTEDASTVPGAFVLEDGPQDTPPVESYIPQDRAVAFFTSGSTGTPKRITRTTDELEREVELVSPVLAGLAPGALVSGTVSHQHVYGLLFRLLWPISHGHRFSALTHQVWETVLDEMRPGGLLVTSPAHLSRLTGISPLKKADQPAQVLSAGAPLPQAAAREAAGILGLFPTEIFGSTETGACAFRDSQNTDANWTPLPSVCFGQTPQGMLRIQSPALPEGVWVETADRVDLQTDGGFRFRGRADRIVKIEGKRVSLPQVERQICALDWIDEAAVTIIPSANNRLGAAVIANAAGRERLAALGPFRFGRLLRRELSATQEPAGLPRLWRFVDALPVSDMGKRRDQDLQALFTREDAS